jgi:hypothetical protein
MWLWDVLYRFCCREDFAEILIKNGSATNAKDSQGRDAKDIAAFYHKESMIKMLDSYSRK